MKIYLLFLLISFNFISASAQNSRSLELQFEPRFGTSSLQLGGVYFKIGENDSIRFNELRWYISGIELWKGDTKLWQEDHSFHLLDAANPKSLKLVLNANLKLEFDVLRFNLGIDSLTNISGAMGGDLDPTQGMYWTWQSGYVNVKLEGQSNVCKTHNNAFQYHLGGYAYPNKALQQLSFPVSNPIKIEVDVASLVSKSELVARNHIMSPGTDAVELSERFCKGFRVVNK
jgi:hypothetical protein